MTRCELLRSRFARLYAERVVRPRRQALVALLEQPLARGELRDEADVEQIADLLAGPPFLRVLPLGLPPVGERYAEELLATIWNGISPRARDGSERLFARSLCARRERSLETLVLAAANRPR